MKRTSLTRRLLAFAMAAAICFSLVPWAVFAAETGTYTQVTSAEEFTSGQYVLITDTGYAPGVLDGSWITAAQPAVTDGTVTDAAGAVWTLSVDGTSVKLTDANGVSVAPKGGNTNGIISGEYSWAWTFADGKFTFAGTGEDTVVLAANGDIRPRLRDFPKCILLLLGMALPVSWVNRRLGTNFMFLSEPEEGTPLMWFHRKWGNHLLGYPPMIAAVMAVMAIPAKLLERLRRKSGLDA